MRITDLLNRDSICLDGTVSTKSEALDAVIDLMVKSGNIADKKEFAERVYAREEEGTTGVGEGIAIPHGKCSAVTKPGLAAMVVPNGVEFEALDGQPVNLIFLIAAPNTKDNIHLDVLSKLSVLMMNDDFTNGLRNAKSVDEFLAVVDKYDEEEAAPNGEREAVVADNAACNILAVTGCPTGIAHTFMAAEALEKKAKEHGCSIKVETRGSGGAKNVFTDEEIEKADFIIVAADTQVPMGRFHGKKLIECQVSDGISKADELIRKAINGDGAVYEAKGGSTQSSAQAGANGGWHNIYKHLMNGVSHMLPFVVGGGILIALAFLIDGLLVDPQVLIDRGSEFGTITEQAAFFKGLGGTAFGFMLPILAGFIAMSIADRPGLALGIVGGAIAANGTSGFLGALVAGFFAGYVIVCLRKVFEKLPAALEGLKPVLIFPLIGILIVGLAMLYIVEPFVGYINVALNNGLVSMSGTSSILLGLVLAAMMAVDMGGPVNKAAYVFGITSIAAGNYGVMAAVMIGGMVPPLAIALSSLIFRNKYTAEERKAAPTNFVMGLAFITEGAIPFAAADPIRVLPSCAIGSAVAGALSMVFNCTLMAPHGGIFVFPVVGNALMYLLALAIGTVVGAVLLGILKKTVQE